MDAQPELLTGAAAFAERAVQLAGGARLELTLLSQELERRLYGGEAFADALRRFVRQHSRTRVRILVNQPQTAVANNPRLVETGRALSSFVEFREVPEPRRQTEREEYLIADGRLLLYRETPQDLASKYFGDAPMEARLKLKQFDALWNESEPAQELRKLGL